MATPPSRSELPAAGGEASYTLPSVPAAIPVESIPGTPVGGDAALDHDPPHFGAVDSDLPFAVTIRTAAVESAPLPPLDVEEEESSDGDPVDHVLSAAPPWLVSLVVHMLGLVVLGFFLLPALTDDELRLNAAFADTFGEQLDETFSLESDAPEEELLVTADSIIVDDPLASPEIDLVPLRDQALASRQFDSPQIGLALSGREPGMKETLLLAYGGNEITEGAVAAALEWLEKQQLSTGAWSLKGPYSNGAGNENQVAATAMALLAFQGAGFTHQTTRPMLDGSGRKRDVDYRRVVRRGWDALLKWQDKDGAFWRKGKLEISHHVLYSQAQVTIAICELYGMTKDEAFRRPAQRAIDYAVSNQDAAGGWRYVPGSDSDTSVTGWFVMALQSARMAGLEVPSDVLEKVSRFLDSVTDDGGSRYSYLPGEGSKPSMTAEALLCRQYLGWSRDDKRLRAGVDYLSNRPIDWSDANSYYWYYATQVMHHMEGEPWLEWNRVMAREIPAHQERKGKEKGSWSPSSDRWAMGGRLYVTCLCTYMLEVYYRHLPIYADLY